MSSDSQNPVMSDLEWLARNVSEWNGSTVYDRILKMNKGPDYCQLIGCDGCGHFRGVETFTREQWAAERQRLGLDSDAKESLTTEWVDGLPPVDENCLAAWLEPPDGGSMIPEPVLIKGYYASATGKQVWLSNADGEDYVFRVRDCTFQPRRTPEEVEREQAIVVAITALGKMNACIVDHRKVLGALYDAGLLRKQGSRS